MARVIRSLVVCASAVVAGCSSGGGGGGSTSFSGTILGPGGTGLQDAGITMSSSTSLAVDPAHAVTDANGNFIVLQPPTGTVDLHIDGSNVPGGTFASLELAIVVGGGATNLSQPIVLPDLAAGTTLSVPVDANGVTTGDMTVTAPDGSAVTIPDMTTILVDGEIPTGPVDVNVTPVDAINVPMPLPGQQDPGAFVTIQPPGAAFNPALDITLPNTRGFPPGTLVDIWSFDHQDGAWVNRSLQTGNQGTVSVDGLFIVATGVITEGGWHAGTLPVDPTCATTISGQVFTLGAPTPLPDVLISLSTGQFARTDASGRFTIATVPAYDASMLPKTCVATDLELRAIAPVSFGSNQVTMTILAGTIVTGGTTTLPAFDIPVVSSGSLVGSVTDSGVGVEGTVSITGTDTLDVDTDSFGSFFVAALDPGPYTATFPFTSGDVSKAFTITANQTTVLNLSAGPAPAGGALTVKVLDFTNIQAGEVVADACVTLKGASGASQFAITNGAGVASFPNAPAGPYTVTAQKDTVVPGPVTNRLATSLVGVTPIASPKTIVIPFLDSNFATSPVITDASFDGTILNPPVGLDHFIFEVDTNSLGGFETSGPVFGTSFSAAIPSGVPLDVAVTAFGPSPGNQILSAVFATNVTATSGGTLMQDFDFNTACSFDQTVNLTFPNLPAHDNFSLGLDLTAAGELSFPLFGGATLPASIDLPDLALAKLLPYDGIFEVRGEDFALVFKESLCDVPLGHATPASLSVALLGVPSIQNPANNANFATYGPGNTVQYTLGSGNGTSTGFNSITFVGGTKTGSDDVFIFWDILVPAATTTFPIPPVAVSKPMFAPGFYFVNVGAVRFDFPGFDFATFFDENFPSNLAAVELLGDCEGDVSHSFTVGQAPLVVDRGARAALKRELKRARLFDTGAR
jgi:hypothetical protein